VPQPFERTRPIKRESELHISEDKFEGVSAYRAEYNKKQVDKQHGYVHLIFAIHFFAFSKTWI
jgi:hypothetical protein